MGCIAIQLLCPRHGQAERASAQALGGTMLGVGRAAGARGVRGTALGARPGRAAGLWAVHLVHSACF